MDGQDEVAVDAAQLRKLATLMRAMESVAREHGQHMVLQNGADAAARAALFAHFPEEEEEEESDGDVEDSDDDDDDVDAPALPAVKRRKLGTEQDPPHMMVAEDHADDGPSPLTVWLSPIALARTCRAVWGCA
jgi:hypothetical protein